MNWHKYPFIRIVVALAMGIALGEFLPVAQLSKPVAFGALAVGLLSLIALHRLIKDYKKRWIIGLDLLLVVVVLGYLVRRMDEPAPLKVRQGTLVARVFDFPEEGENTVKVFLELVGRKVGTTKEPLEGKVVSYFQKTDEALRLRYGDLLTFTAAIDDVPPPQNPEEFDYRRYLLRKGVSGRVYLQSDDWHPLGVNAANPLVAFAGRFRSRLLEALRRNGINDDEFGSGAAILLGYDDGLSQQLRQHYVAAGSMHILCVSGMHVGIIYLLASFLLGFIGKDKKMAMARKLILLLLIWFYALLTGLTASIMRSSLMITMMIVGTLTHRKGNVLNSIAASAFVILLINPTDLFSMGFQLSYGAVVGIVILQRPIYLLIYIGNKWLDKVWEITSVSLAAQVATMPLTVFYFHQFTPYFWLSNLLMTPLSFLAILSGMSLFLVSWMPHLSLWVGKAVWACLHVMNGVAEVIDRLPWSLVKGLYMNGFEFGLSLLMLLLLYLIVKIRRKRMLMELLTLSCLMAGSMAIRAYRVSQQCSMVVYSLKNHTAIDLIQGTAHLLLCDEGLLSDPSAIDYSLKGAWARWQLFMNPPCYTLSDEVAVGCVLKQGNFISFQGQLWALWDPSLVVNATGEALPVDVLLVRGKQIPELQRVVKAYHPDLLLVDGSVPKYHAKGWEAQAATMGIPCVCVGDGAYVCDLAF